MEINNEYSCEKKIWHQDISHTYTHTLKTHAHRLSESVINNHIVLFRLRFYTYSCTYICLNVNQGDETHAHSHCSHQSHSNYIIHQMLHTNYGHISLYLRFSKWIIRQFWLDIFTKIDFINDDNFSCV